MNISIRTVLLLILLVITVLATQSCRADCFDTAARYEHVNPKVLRAIAIVESQNNPHAINHNANHSVDLGTMQINSIHMPELNRFGVHQRDLMDGCKNIYVGAWLLKHEMKKYGNSWKAIGGYHSETPEYRDLYALKVKKEVYKLASSSR